MKVFTLLTARKRDLEATSTLTFDTIRTGFPDAHIHVDLQGKYADWFELKGAPIDSSRVFQKPEIHGDWIRKLVYQEELPFIIADPDLVFLSRFPIELCYGASLVGEFVPEFNCPVSRCLTKWRYHTALMYIDPLRLRMSIRDWKTSIGETPFTPPIDLFRAVVLPVNGKNVFYDTCSLLAHAVGGCKFSSEMMESYRHLHAGTWSDIVEKSMPGFQAMHQEALKNKLALLNLRENQAKFYEVNA